MSRISNSRVGILNSLVFLLSISILGSCIWPATSHGTDCNRFMQCPVMIIVLFIMLVSYKVQVPIFSDKVLCQTKN
ncbi:hypothetical protein SUGI_0101130 [Cryptomeria japonica]|nr:hypothetical protein SUGI_0101130 [Cryptomeria japonica]